MKTPKKIRFRELTLDEWNKYRYDLNVNQTKIFKDGKYTYFKTGKRIEADPKTGEKYFLWKKNKWYEKEKKYYKFDSSKKALSPYDITTSKYKKLVKSGVIDPYIGLNVHTYRWKENWEKGQRNEKRLKKARQLKRANAPKVRRKVIRKKVVPYRNALTLRKIPGTDQYYTGRATNLTIYESDGYWHISGNNQASMTWPSVRRKFKTAKDAASYAYRNKVQG